MTTDNPYDIASKLLAVAPDLHEHIARCCEQAYRRGYQQGSLYGHGLDAQITDWRFCTPANPDPEGTPATARYGSAIAPPDRRDIGLPAGSTYGWSCSAVERLRIEASNASDLVAALMHRAGD